MKDYIPHFALLIVGLVLSGLVGSESAVGVASGGFFVWGSFWVVKIGASMPGDPDPKEPENPDSEDELPDDEDLDFSAGGLLPPDHPDADLLDDLGI